MELVGTPETKPGRGCEREVNVTNTTPTPHPHRMLGVHHKAMTERPGQKPSPDRTSPTATGERWSHTIMDSSAAAPRAGRGAYELYRADANHDTVDKARLTAGKTSDTEAGRRSRVRRNAL